MTHSKPDNAPPTAKNDPALDTNPGGETHVDAKKLLEQNQVKRDMAAASKLFFDPDRMEQNDKYVASLPDWVKGSPVNRREPDNALLACFICGKQKGQPPDRCNGHYENAPTPTGPVLSAEQFNELIQHIGSLDILTQTPGTWDQLINSHEALRAILAQRDKRVEELTDALRPFADAWKRRDVVGQGTSAQIQCRVEFVDVRKAAEVHDAAMKEPE